MAHVERTVLLHLRDDAHSVSFRIERWFWAADDRVESMSKPVLVWTADGSDKEQVALLDTDAVRAVIGELMPFA